MAHDLEAQIQENSGATLGILNDPITGEVLQNPVRANDGVIYNQATADTLRQHRQRGAKGLLITSYQKAGVEIAEAVGMATASSASASGTARPGNR